VSGGAWGDGNALSRQTAAGHWLSKLNRIKMFEAYNTESSEGDEVLVFVEDRRIFSILLGVGRNQRNEGDIQPGYGMHFWQVQSDVRAIKERLVFRQPSNVG